MRIGDRRPCGHTIGTGGDCNDNSQRPIKDEREQDQRDDYVDKRGNDVEQDKLCNMLVRMPLPQ